MNQKSKNLLGPRSAWLSCKLLSLLTVSLIFVALPSYATAQNQFAPANNFQRSNFKQPQFQQPRLQQPRPQRYRLQRPQLGNWVPPNTTGSVYQNNGSSNRASGVSFPESVAPFDTGIRTANFQAPVADIATAPSITDRIDGAAATFSKWKDIAGEKASELMSNAKQEGGWIDKAQSFIGSSDVKKMLGSLALVLGLYFAFVWLMRQFKIGGNSGLPSEIVEVLGQVPFGARRSLQLVRLGSKVLLLLNSPEGTQPLGEISDPGEVEHLISLCKGKRRSRSQLPAAVQQAAQIASGGAALGSAAALGNATLGNAAINGAAAIGNAALGSASSIGSAALNAVQNNAVQNNAVQNTSQPKLGNIGSTSLNDVIRILQHPGRAVYEA